MQVCPTGIDIRNGLQYECIGCTACIDVCNGVMDKMQYPRGLIRYDTQNGLQQHLSRADVLKRVLRPRVLAYTAVLVLVCAGLLFSLLTRAPFMVDVVRDRGVLARVVDDGWVENVYRLQIMNVTEAVQNYRINAEGLPGIATDLTAEVSVQPAQARWVPVALRVPPEVAQAAGPGAHVVRFQIERLAETGGLASHTLVEKSTFVVPR